jgi:hypothetical protein
MEEDRLAFHAAGISQESPTLPTGWAAGQSRPKSRCDKVLNEGKRSLRLTFAEIEAISAEGFRVRPEQRLGTLAW